MNIYILDQIPLMREALTVQVRRIQATANIITLDSVEAFSDNVKSAESPPDLVISDVHLSDSSGLNTVIQIKMVAPHSPLLVLAEGVAGVMEDATISAGADLFIPKATSVADFTALLSGVISPHSELVTQVGVIKMSKRQKQLMVMLNAGLSNREIGEKLEISEHTVKVHLWRFFKKIGVNSRTQALVYARANGYI
jgi:DNA-binding NarL/FixJ family response regulator